MEHASAHKGRNCPKRCKERGESCEYADENVQHKGDGKRGEQITQRSRKETLQAELAAAKHEADRACAAINTGGQFAVQRAAIDRLDEKRKQQGAEEGEHHRHERTADDAQRFSIGRLVIRQRKQGLQHGQHGDAHDQEQDNKIQAVIADERAKAAAKDLSCDPEHAAQRERADADWFIFMHRKVPPVNRVRHGKTPLKFQS